MRRDLPTGDPLADEQNAETRWLVNAYLALVGVFVFILGCGVIGWILLAVNS